MDNVCHTLVGAALGEAGLKSRTRYGNITLMVAANLPDLDVLVFATSVPAVSFRRGWTHGVVAQALLPIALACTMLAIDRARRARGQGRPVEDGPGARFLWLTALSYLGLYSHVFLDYLNTYGIRLLAPVDWRWFYGDAVFIIDVWLWIMLGAGVWLARRTGRLTPARGALVFAGAYIVTMLASAAAASTAVGEAWNALRGSAPRALMVGPVPVTPFRRDVVVDAGSYYQAGRFSWPAGALRLTGEPVPKNADAPEVGLARQDARIRGFLVWSRFPFWELTPVESGMRVTVRDMRFGNRFSESAIVRRE